MTRRPPIKRVIYFFSAFALVLGAGLLLWQPGPLKKKAVDWMLRKVNSTKPYQITVDNVRGNFFWGVTLEGVRITLKKPPAPLLESPSLRLGFDWRALLRHRLHLRHLVIFQPVLHVTIDAQKHLLFPLEDNSLKPAEPSPFTVEITDFRVQKGQIRIMNQSLQGNPEVTFEKIELESSLEPLTLEVHHLQFSLEKGLANLQGHFLRSAAGGHATFQMKKLPLHKLLELGAPLFGSLELPYSGKGRWAQSNKLITLSTQGQLADSGLDLNATWNPQGSTQGHLLLRPKNDPLYSLTLEAALERGVGPVTARLKGKNLGGSVQGIVDLPRQKGSANFWLEVQDLSQGSLWAKSLRETHGRLLARGKLGFSKGQWNVKSELHAGRVVWQRKTLNQFDGSFAWSGAKELIDFQGSAQGLLWQEPPRKIWNVKNATLSLKGSSPRGKSQAMLHFENDSQVSYDGFWRHKDGSWRLGWKSLALKLSGNASAWQAGPEGEILVENDQWVLRRFDLQNGPQKIMIPKAIVRDHFYAATFKSHQVQIAPWVKLFNSSGTAGILESSGHLQNEAGALQGKMVLELSTGSLQGWKFDKIALDTTLQDPWVIISQARLVAHGQTLLASGKIPWTSRDSAPELPMFLSAKASHLDPSAFGFWRDLKIKTGGSVDLDVHASGVWPHLYARGSLAGKIPQLSMESLGLELQDINSKISLRGKTIEIQKFTARTEKGVAELTGQSTIPSLDFALRCKNLQLNSPRKFKVTLDSNLKLIGSLDAPDLEGDISLKEGIAYAPEEKKGKTAPPEAAPQKKSSPSLWEKMASDIHVQWPRNVWYRENTSNIETKGDLRLKKLPNNSANLTGTVSLVRGSYTYYGKNFIIDSGDIHFTGSPEPNPLLNITTEYRSQETTVFLNVGGTAKEPSLTLSSNPPMSNDDIVSVLAFGAPLSELRSSSTKPNADQEMAQVTGQVLGGYLTNRLRESGLDLGLDVVRIEPGDEGSRLTLGRYFGRNLFFSVGQSVGPHSNQVLHGEYFVSPHWTLLAETGAANQGDHMDFQFRYPLNAPPTQTGNP